MSIDRNAIARMTRDLQREFDKHPIRVPIEADPDAALPPATTVNNYNGPVVMVSGDNAQLAWNNDTVNQTQNQEIAPGYEDLARLVTDLVANLDTFELDGDDAQDVLDSAQTVLGEVVKERPDQGIVRRSVKVMKGALAPIVTGVGRTVSDESAESARRVIEQLGSALPF